MKILYVYLCIILTFLFTSLLPAQNIITFDDQGWNPDQSLDSSFTIGNFTFSGTQKFFTNYGYNFNVDSNSIFFLFQNKSTDKITITTSNNEPFNLISLALYQVSQQSTDSLVIEGWYENSEAYTRSFAYDTVWTTSTLNYNNINKVVIKIDSAGNGGISDYNFDNITYDFAVPVELTDFRGAAEESDIKLEWTTATELNNYGFDIERKDSISDWEKVGFIKAKGTQTIPNHYSFADNKVENGYKYKYRLKQIDLGGSYKYSNEIEIVANLVPLSYELSQNYPNPFNPVTTINYKLPHESKVTINIYNILGEEISTLVNENKEAGKYSVRFDGSGYSSGVYIYELRAGSFVSRIKMMLIK